MLILRECTLVESHGVGAIHVTGGEVLIEDSILANNSAPNGKGGALLVTGGRVELLRAHVVDNAAAVGGAVAIEGADTVVHVQATTVARNNASHGAGGAFDVSGGTLVLTAGTLLDGNVAALGAGGRSIAITGGKAFYALPGPSGRWVPSGFLCKEYRVPCAADAVGCDPEQQPPLETQPCDHANPLINGKTISVLLPGESIDADFPFACAPGLFLSLIHI